ncbi:MAG: glycosyl transferase family 41 [Selenomonas sp.]|uniref:O-linked N-acetylglucosamine transferase, SPINDLY family protein n=1 Tax=Selenomonas sp. TaxID=2053611 RepID=UPI0025E9BF6E|nr:glycosyl transferase family 41 [Selenomonas sp.]MCR5758136.1 glycosyl transferase family 41 [Selenomonas sp.]
MEAQWQEIIHLLQQGRTQAAREKLDALRGSVPDDALWRFHELYGAVFHDLADAEGAAAAYCNAAQCDKYLRSQREHFSSYLFALHYLPGLSAADLWQQHRYYAELYREEEYLPPRQIVPHSRLRIGFIAHDFCNSAAARFYEVLVTGLDVRYASTYLYALHDEEDAFTHRLQGSGLVYRCLQGKNLVEMAESIRWDEIDILVDLSGHTDGGMTLMVLAKKPAPVQLSAIGYMDTTGLEAVDGVLTDNVLDPAAGDAGCFQEELVKLPQAFCFTPTESMQKYRRRRRKLGTPITFGSFQNGMKLNREVLDLWREVLDLCPEARMVVQDTTRLPERRKVLEKRLEKAGLPMERTEVRLGTDSYLADYQEMDIMLDTFPYNGGAMTATALYMGVPVVSLRGDHHSARFGASILTAAGYEEWIADTKKDYLKCTLQLAADAPFLADIQENLRSEVEQSPLCDSTQYTGAFWQACIELWARKGDFVL